MLCDYFSQDRDTCVCFYTCEGPLSTVQLDVCLFRPFFFFFVKLLDQYYSVSWVLLRLLKGVIFIAVLFYYSVLPFVPL
jgi:hypothetical protein